MCTYEGGGVCRSEGCVRMREGVCRSEGMWTYEGDVCRSKECVRMREVCVGVRDVYV